MCLNLVFQSINGKMLLFSLLTMTSVIYQVLVKLNQTKQKPNQAKTANPFDDFLNFSNHGLPPVCLDLWDNSIRKIRPRLLLGQWDEADTKAKVVLASEGGGKKSLIVCVYFTISNLETHGHQSYFLSCAKPLHARAGSASISWLVTPCERPGKWPSLVPSAAHLSPPVSLFPYLPHLATSSHLRFFFKKGLIFNAFTKVKHVKLK